MRLGRLLAVLVFCIALPWAAHGQTKPTENVDSETAEVLNALQTMDILVDIVRMDRQHLDLFAKDLKQALDENKDILFLAATVLRVSVYVAEFERTLEDAVMESGHTSGLILRLRPFRADFAERNTQALKTFTELGLIPDLETNVGKAQGLIKKALLEDSSNTSGPR